MRTLVLISILLFGLPSFAASPVWLVESANSQIYLAGTIHLLRASDYPLPKGFERAYSNSQLLVFETRQDNQKDTEFSQLFLKTMLLPANTGLEQLLGEHSLSRLSAYLRDNQLSLNQFSQLRPSMIAITLTVRELKKLGASEQGVDQFYFNKALQDEKKILTLESLQQQLEFLANMGKGQEDQMIEQTLDEIEMLNELFSEMVTSWRNGDSAQMESLFLQPMQEKFASLYQSLLVQRNQNWLPQIIELLKSQETEMILVGSAHLLGQDGLLKLLQQQGFRVTQLD